MEDTNFASRKFLMTCALQIATLVLFVMGKIDQSTWADVTIWTLGIYCSANAATWAAEYLKGRP